MTADISYSVDDRDLTGREFFDLATRVWPGEYAISGVELALERTINITARAGDRLIGSVRVLTDGYFFGTIPELLVDPDYQGRGVGRRLMELAWEASPTSLYFGAQAGKEEFYENLGFEHGLQSFFKRKPRDA